MKILYAICRYGYNHAISSTIRNYRENQWGSKNFSPWFVKIFKDHDYRTRKTSHDYLFFFTWRASPLFCTMYSSHEMSSGNLDFCHCGRRHDWLLHPLAGHPYYISILFSELSLSKLNFYRYWFFNHPRSVCTGLLVIRHIFVNVESCIVWLSVLLEVLQVGIEGSLAHHELSKRAEQAVWQSKPSFKILYIDTKLPTTFNQTKFQPRLRIRHVTTPCSAASTNPCNSNFYLLS